MTIVRALAVSLLCAACPPAPPAEVSAVEPNAPPTASVADVTSALTLASTSLVPGPPLEVQEHTLDAKVKSVSPISTQAGSALAVDADPRFVVELELFGVAPGMADDPKGSALVAGATVAFSIHSPARLFKSDGDMAGKRMHFSVTRTRTKSGISFSALRTE